MRWRGCAGCAVPGISRPPTHALRYWVRPRWCVLRAEGTTPPEANCVWRGLLDWLVITPKLVEVTDVFGPFELYPVQGVQLFGSELYTRSFASLEFLKQGEVVIAR